MANKPRVFIVNDNGSLNFKKAQRFGDLVTLTRNTVYPDTDENEILTMVAEMNTILANRKYNPLTDYLLLAGDPVALVMVGILAGTKLYQEIQLLKYDTESKGYYVVTI